MSGGKKDERVCAALSLRDGCAFYGELLKDGEGYGLVNADVISLPSGLLQDDRIQDAPALGLFLRKELNFRWRKLPLILGVPSSDCVFRPITLPEMDFEEARSALFWNFSEYFAYKPEEALFDLCPIPSPVPQSGKFDVMAVVSLRSRLMPLFDALTNRRSCVAAAEPQIVACARSLSALEDLADELSLLAVTFQSAAHIVLFYGNAGILFRTVAFEGGPSELENDHRAVAVRDEILKTLSYASTFCGDLKVRRLCVAGHSDVAEELRAMPEFPLKTVGVSVKDYYPLRFDAPSDESWSDVAGLLLRYADEN